MHVHTCTNACIYLNCESPEQVKIFPSPLANSCDKHVQNSFRGPVHIPNTKVVC